MFDLLNAKLGQATAFADGLVNLDALNMDRMREEQEKQEESKEESRRLLGSSELSSGGSTLSVGMVQGNQGVDSIGNRRGGKILEDSDISSADIEMGNQRMQRKQPRTVASSDVGLRPATSRMTDEDSAHLPRLDDGGNFEDQFDPILASIRDPPRRTRKEALSLEHSQAPAQEEKAGPAIRARMATTPKGPPRAGATFAAGFLSILPDNMRSRAGEVMAQSARTFRSALDSGVPGTSGFDKRRHSGPSPPLHGDTDFEEGKAFRSAGGRRAAAAAAAAGGEESAREEDELRTVNANELLSDEERRQLAAFSGAAGGGIAGGICAWRRLRSWIVVSAGVMLVCVLFYLWRWTTLTVADEGSVITGIEAERALVTDQ